MFYHLIVFALQILGLNAAKEKLEIVASFQEAKTQKNPEKNIGANHILILGEENF